MAKNGDITTVVYVSENYEVYVYPEENALIANLIQAIDDFIFEMTEERLKRAEINNLKIIVIRSAQARVYVLTTKDFSFEFLEEKVKKIFDRLLRENGTIFLTERGRNLVEEIYYTIRGWGLP